MNIVRALALAVAALLLPFAGALAEDTSGKLVLGDENPRRVALVLGNSAYQHAPPLANPVSDARSISEKVKALGFEVVEGFNLTKAQTQETIARFARTVRGAEIALFFYAGHGMQVAGSNYLLPVDAALEDETSLDFETVQIDFVLRQMSRETSVRLVFLDACRDNPLAKVLAESGGSERASTASSGLAEVQMENSGAGTLIAFATSPNEVAYDGKGEHSPFSQALLSHIGEPNLPLSVAMTRVTGDVFKATSGLQRPWVNVSLTDEVILNRVTEPEPAPVVASAPTGQADSASRTAGAGVNNMATDEGQIALNLLRQKIPKLETTGPIGFNTPIAFGDPLLDGKSIAQLIDGKPIYSPIEGLEEAAWDVQCSSCHEWTQQRLCEQATTYVKIDISIMRLEHPYGTRFKVALANWASEGCK